MSAPLDSIRASTKLRHATLEVQQELEATREEYNTRLARIRDGEAQLARDRAELQDTLVQYYKFIQENELKRSRATKKAVMEEKQCRERDEQLTSLNAHLQALEQQRQAKEQQLAYFVKYEHFLNDVLARNDGSEYQEPKDVIQRWMTLQDNTAVLQGRKTQLEEDLLRSRNSLNLARQHRTNENVSLQNELNELQVRFERMQKSIKLKQDELERRTRQQGSTTRVVSHVSMAARNLYDRCLNWTAAYASRGRSEGRHSSEVLAQLRVIGECLEDYQAIILKAQEKAPPQQ